MLIRARIHKIGTGSDSPDDLTAIVGMPRLGDLRIDLPEHFVKLGSRYVIQAILGEEDTFQIVGRWRLGPGYVTGTPSDVVQFVDQSVIGARVIIVRVGVRSGAGVQ